MADHLTASDPFQEAQSRAGVQSIDELLDERATLIEQCATLRAVYGSFGTFDHLRKIELSRLKGLVRAQATRDKVKLNNDQVDDDAHAHADYIDFIRQATTDRAKWVRLENQIEAVSARIFRGNAMIRFVSNEIQQ